MRTTCLPNIINLSLHPINSCVAGKQALNIAEATEKITSKDIYNIEGGHGTLHAAIEQAGQLPVDSTLVKASNLLMQEHPHGKGDAKLGGLPPTHPHNAKGKVLLQALEGANHALATGAVASNPEHLFMRVKRHMTRKAGAHVKCPKADDGLTVSKRTLTWHGKPNIQNIEGQNSDRVCALAVCGDLLYTASESKDIRAFRAPMFEELDCFGGGTEAVQSLLAFEDFLYSAHQDNKIRVWKRPEGCAGSRSKHKLVAVLPKLEHCVQSMLSKRNYVQVRRHKRKLWIEHADRISALALGGYTSRSTSETGNGMQGRPYAPSVLYSASWDKTVKVWSLDKFKCMESFHAHHDAINAMIVIDGGILVTASADHTIKLWTKMNYPARKKKHGLMCTLEGHKAAVNALALSADSEVLYSGAADGTLLAWKKVYVVKAQGARRSMIKGALSGTLSGEVVKQFMSGKGKISRGGSLAKQSSLGSCAVMSRDVSGEVFVETSGSDEIVISRGNSLNRHALSSLKKVINYHNRLNALSAGSVSFVMKKKLMGHTRSVLSVSTVGDSVVCSSSADKTIRVWLRAREKRWEYTCMAVLAGNGGPVKAIAAVMSARTTPDSTCCSSSTSMLHARENLRAAPGDSASHFALEDQEKDEQGFIVYSGGLYSKVYALQIPAS